MTTARHSNNCHQCAAGPESCWCAPDCQVAATQAIAPPATTLDALDELLAGIEQRMETDDLDVSQPGMYSRVLEARTLVARMKGGAS